MKKYLKFTILLFVFLMLSTVCFAATPVAKGDATMVLVEDNVNTMVFGEHGEFEKKMTQIDTVNKTIDIRLTARNKAELQETTVPAEVVLLIDASNSMSTNRVVVNNVEMTRKELVLDAAQQLIDKLLANSQDIKIGIVEFATDPFDVDEGGQMLPGTSEEGTSADAKILTESLTNDSTVLTQALNTIKTDVMGARTDVEIGLEKAEELLATSTATGTNKYIVTLTDAVPNTAKGVVSDLYTEASAVPTKNKLAELDGKGIEIISLLIDISDDEIKISGRPEDATFKTYKDVAEFVFGTALNPTAGTVYYVDDDDVIDTVTESVYSKLIVITEYYLKDIVIKDYFPQNIIDNFNFSYLTKPEIGEVTASVNPEDNSITWTISELKEGEEATFTYRLTLKDTFSSEIVGKNLPTNENVTIDFKENDVPGDTVENDKAPIVALDVPAPKEIPQTGSNTPIVAGIIALVSIVAISSFIAIKRNNLK